MAELNTDLLKNPRENREIRDPEAALRPEDFMPLHIGYTIFAAAGTVLLLVLTYLAWREEGAVSWYLPAAIGLSVLAGILAFVRMPFKVYGIIRDIILVAGIPFAAILLVQNFFINPLGVKGIYPLMLAANAVFYYLLYLLLSFVFGRFRIGYTVSTLVFLIIGIANYFVMAFRSSPIVPWDLFSLGTAASVANNYTYSISWRFLWSFMGFWYLVIFSTKIRFRVKKPLVRIALTVLTLAGLLLAAAALQRKDVKDKLGMDQTLFTPTVRYRNNGFLAAFLGNLHLINIQEPDGYSVAQVEKIQEDVEGSHQQEIDDQLAGYDAKKAPNIIVIMDEAFSDLAVRGDFNVSQDYMPNFRRLMEEHTGGNLMVSVKGGNTANTEYEFLTGDTMAFLPAGSVVYQQFIRDNVPALPSYLASLGYATTGIHPYYGTGWDREKVYPLLGFEEFYDIDDFGNPVYLRNYVSDQSAFEKVIDVMESSDPDEPQFIFEVTMQNHSGYSKEFPGFSEEIFLTDVKNSTTQTRAAEKYLTLIYESDKALGSLMDYFEAQDDPTIIVMFGDHQPSDYVTAVIDRITGYNPDTENLEDAQNSYIVPFFVWSNFDMDLKLPDMISVNYLAGSILRAAGIPMTDYQLFLQDLKEKIPVICAGCYVDPEGNYHSFDEENADFDPLLRDYNILQYNHMTDISHRVLPVFIRQLPLEE